MKGAWLICYSVLSVFFSSLFLVNSAHGQLTEEHFGEHLCRAIRKGEIDRIKELLEDASDKFTDRLNRSYPYAFLDEQDKQDHLSHTRPGWSRTYLPLILAMEGSSPQKAYEVISLLLSKKADPNTVCLYFEKTP